MKHRSGLLLARETPRAGNDLLQDMIETQIDISLVDLEIEH
jgi:hypothetical protein